MSIIEATSRISQKLSILLQTLQSLSEDTEINSISQDANLRKETLKLSKRLVAALEQPEEVVMRWGFEVRDRYP